MAQEARRRLLALHGRFMIAGALLALLITIVDQALGIGKGDWFSFENVLSYFAWGAFAVDAALATAFVLVLARCDEHVIIINLVAPLVLLCALFAVLSPSRSQRGHQMFSLEGAIAASPKCLGGITRWSWTEPDPLSASVHLELTMPASNTVEFSIWGEFLEPHRDTRVFPAGKSSLDVPLARYSPGRPDSWYFDFKCEEPELEIGYAAKVDNWQVQECIDLSHPSGDLTQRTSAHRERISHDFFYFGGRKSWDARALTIDTSFLIRPASHEILLDRALERQTGAHCASCLCDFGR